MNRKIYKVLTGILCMAVTASAQIPIGNKASAQRTRLEQQEPQIGFRQNKGQLHDQEGRVNSSVKYLLSMKGLNVQLRATGFSYDAWLGKDSDLKFHRVDIMLEGANPDARLVAEQPDTEVTNVFNEYGSFTDIHSYHKVTYQDVYPGIDLEFIARQGKDKPVEYNFIVHPGADASQIRMKYNSGSEISLNNNKVEMHLAFGTLKENIPASYTQQDGRSLAVRYKALDETANLYAFNVPDYDKSKTLVIDPTPTLQWATYYGGVGADNMSSTDMDIDAAGNMYLTGSTASTSNIATVGAHQIVYGGGTVDAFLLKFSPTGQLLWGTYYGGALFEKGSVVRVDGTSVYLAGSTQSSSGIAFNGYQNTIGGGSDGFLVKFNAATGARIWGTFYGGTGAESINAMAITPDGSILVGGNASSTTIMATPGAFVATGAGLTCGFVARFTASGARDWGSYVRAPTGNNSSSQVYRIASDAAGNPIISGIVQTTSTNFGTPGTFQPLPPANGSDMFVLKLNATGTSRIWGTFIGSTVVDILHDMAIDHAGNILVFGHMGTAAAPVGGMATAGSYQTPGVTNGGLLVKLDANGARLWSTYLPATNALTRAGLDVDESNNVMVAATTATPGIATSPCAYQAISSGGNEMYIAKLSADGTSRFWATYWGTSTTEDVSNLVYTGNGKFVVSAQVDGSGLATPGAFRSATDGLDGLLGYFNEQTIIPSDISAAASVLNPVNQTACILGIPGYITGNTVTYTTASYFTSPVYYQWQSASSATGPWTDIAGEIFKDLQPPPAQVNRYYRRLVQVAGSGCGKTVIDSSAVASVLVNSNLAPIAHADGLQWYVCNAPGNTVTLNGSATGGTGPYTYQWFAGGSTTPSANTATFTPATTQSTTYTLRVTDASGCIDVDQATVVPAIANAGQDKSICQGSGGVQIGTTPVSTPNVAYSWTLANGSPATTLSCTNCAQPIANPVAAASYVLTVTVTRKDNSTCTSTDTVTVTPVAAPNSNLVFANSDTTICRGAAATLRADSAADFTYNWSPGQYLSDANTRTPVFNPGSVSINCSKIYTVTATSNGCSFTDNVTVTVVNSSITFEGQNKCGPLWIDQSNGTNCIGATYSWSVVNGTGTILQTANSNASAYLNSPTGTTTFRRTTTVNGVSCSADVLVSTCGSSACDFNIVTTSGQGCPKVFGSGGSFTLTVAGISAADYNFSWSPANLVSNPTAATVAVTSTANTTLTCTITNKYDSTITCSKSIEINNPAWTLPSFTFPDKNICGSTATAIGIAPVGGVLFTWLPATGLDDDSTNNPMATLTTNRNYIITGTEIVSGCKSKDTMTVNVANVIADAGPDRAICNGATVLLGTPPPVGTNYTYSWQPTGAAYQNGTGPTNPQPQVLFASASQTFTVTVTDPVSGCTAIDNVTLSGTLTTGTYSGAGDTACPGQVIQLGQPNIGLATYQWVMADNSPALGLSCTTCANPMLTAPDATSTYKVQVSYPGCTLPLEDTVKVIVNSAPAIALANQAYCPSSPINIGFGSSGNPAAPANVTAYQWTPATGLSSATAANPTTNVTIPVTYVVKVTYTNGCERKDSVQVTPTAIANAGPDKTVCPGGSVNIGTPAIVGTIYSWSGGPITGSSAIAQPVASPTTSSAYVVSATANGCTATDSVLVDVSTPPAFTIVGNTTICAGGTATVGLSAAAAIGSGWQWTPATGVANATSPNTTIAAVDTQVYRLTQTVAATGCSNYQEIIVVVSPNTITASAIDTSICSGNTIALPLTVTSAGSYQYLWSPSTGLSDPYMANPMVTATLDQTYTVTITDNISQCQNVQSVDVTIKPEIECYPPVSLSGNVFHDANGLKDLTVNSTTVSPIPSGLYVTLVDSANNPVSTIAVASNGAFNFGITPIGQYSIVLHQTSTGSVTPALPANWLFMGENLGTGIGSDDALNGILTEISVLATNVTNANLGIEQPPVSDPKTYAIDAPAANDTIPLNGTHVSTGPGTSSPGQMTGNDAEDGALNGTGNNKTLVITAAPNYGQLRYNGTMVTAGEKIINYNPSLLSIIITDTTNNTVSFQYAYVDQAGVESAPVSYTINWGAPLPITLIDFKAVKVNTTALLQWETAKEEHTSHFIVERSADSRSWKSIGQVTAAGNSNAILKYELNDETPLQGSNYYRLKTIFPDGGHEMSMIRRLEFSEQTGKIMIVPNPAHKSATLVLDKTYKAPIQVKVSNILGQTIHTYTIPAGTNKYPIDLDGMAQGMYTISIDRYESIKLIVE
jgi:hypothetical protein